MLIDQLAKKQNVTFTHDKIFQADLASFFLNGEKIYPCQTNDIYEWKWKRVHALLTYYGLILKIYSSFTMILTWKLERFCLRAKGSVGGHNGIKSIIQHIGTQTFNRVKIGIGRPKMECQLFTMFWVPLTRMTILVFYSPLTKLTIL